MSRRPAHRCAITVLCAAAVLLAGVTASRAAPASEGGPLRLDDVLESITRRYPPLLAALIERDIAAGRLQSAGSAFDFNVFAKIFGTPAGYYRSGTVDVGVEQFTGIWGSTIFGGYRLTRGETLPDYYATRTQGGGEPRVGLSVPLLRDGAIDRRRATLLKADIDRALADPLIARQYIDFVRAGTVAYFNWLAAGRRWALADALLRIANDRTDGLTRQASAGLLPRIVLTDNQRLVVAREIGIVQARRRFEGAALALSLFIRTSDDEPVVAGRPRLPDEFPAPESIEPGRVETDVEQALEARPELRRLQLGLDKLEVDRRLARNQLQPNLDVGVVLSQDVGKKLYSDKSDFEVQAGVELKLPLQRREAKGRVTELESQIEQVRNEQRFARDRIQAEVRDAYSALLAAQAQIQQTRLNADLAVELQSAEEERFRRGATDLLALQLREQAAFDAQTQAVDAIAEAFRALADYRAAIAAGVAGTVLSDGGPKRQ